MAFQKPTVCIFSEKGSITVLVALMLPILLLMVILVANIGQLVFEKIRLQNTVDICALAAATVQSAGLNEIADLNWEMRNEHHKLKELLESDVWYDKGEAQDAIRFFHGSSGVLDHIYRYQMAANRDYALDAWDIALEVKDQNLPDSTLVRLKYNPELADFEIIEKKVSYRYYDKSCSSCDKKTTLKWSDPDDPRYYDHHDGSKKREKKRKKIKRGKKDIPELIEKISQAFVMYELHQPAKEFSLGKRLFKPMPALTARAAAKPAGGHTLGCDPSYRAELFK